jgi:hypothetical protein
VCSMSHTTSYLAVFDTIIRWSKDIGYLIISLEQIDIPVRICYSDDITSL